MPQNPFPFLLQKQISEICGDRVSFMVNARCTLDGSNINSKLVGVMPIIRFPFPFCSILCVQERELAAFVEYKWKIPK